MMKDFWDERYCGKEFVYGKKPNEYLNVKLTELHKGKILLPAEGEGRNAVYAAKLGWMVSAFDQSTNGKEKAEILAKKNGVAINYIISDVEEIRYPENSFDVLALVYAHFHSDKRTAYHQKLSSYLRKGGILILEAFGKRHMENQKINPNAGGPRNVAMLYELEELVSDFEGFEFLEAIETKTELNEGKHHLGEADVIRIFATKNSV